MERRVIQDSASLVSLSPISLSLSLSHISVSVSYLCLASLFLIPGFRSAASGLRRSTGVLG